MENKHKTKSVALQEDKVYIGETDTQVFEEENNNSNNNLTKFKDEVDDYYKKKKVKKTLSIIVCMLVVLVLGFFGYKYLNDNYKLKDGQVEKQGEIFLFENNNSFTLDGVAYSFPLKAQDLVDNGWNIIFDYEEYKVDKIGPYDYAYVVFQKDDKEFTATLASHDEEEIPLEQGDIESIDINNQRTPSFIGPLNLSIGDDESKVLEAIINSGYAYECNYYKSSNSTSYYFSLKDAQYDTGYYYSYYVNCYNKKLNNMGIYYRNYNYN